MFGLSFYLFYYFQIVGSWPQTLMLPCPIKFLTGFDCPGCGFQRSLFALLEGNFETSFMLYPATIPLLILGITIVAKEKFFPNSRNLLVNAMTLVVGFIMLLSYGWKIWLS